MMTQPTPSKIESQAKTNPNSLNIPIPDPSLLTTALMEREINTLRELQDARHGYASQVNSLIRTILETRLDGMDKAIQLLQSTADKFPARIDEKISSLERLHEEKFSSIQTQFKERDVRTEQSSKDSKVAVDAALQAAKEAVGEQNKSSSNAIAKSESATTKQIDQLGLNIASMSQAFDGKLNDVKDRLTRMEGSREGKASTGAFIAMAIGLILTFILGGAGILISLLKHQ